MKKVDIKMTDQLVEINRKDLPTLVNLYKNSGFEHYVAYMTIVNYMRWIDNNKNEKYVKFYCLNDDFSDGTFVVMVSTKV